MRKRIVQEKQELEQFVFWLLFVTSRRKRMGEEKRVETDRERRTRRPRQSAESKQRRGEKEEKKPCILQECFAQRKGKKR